MRRLLWVSDAACDSGFARGTHNILEGLRHEFHVAVLGVNYFGDPHPYPYPIYPASRGGGDFIGSRRLLELCVKLQPDVVVIQTDPWHIPRYLKAIDALERKPVMVGALAVDGKNVKVDEYRLNELDHVIFWTEFARQEAIQGGYKGTADVVGLGVNLDIYSPGDRTEARKLLCWDQEPLASAVPMDAFLVVNVNRNQPRKRLDLTFQYFAEFRDRYDAKDAFLYLHVAPTGDVGYDCKQLARYFGLKGRVILMDPGVEGGMTEKEICLTYRAADVLMTTTQGEGWGLTTLEAMACGLPCVVPEWSALGEWARPAAMEIPCDQIAVTPSNVNVIGGIANREAFVRALGALYQQPSFRDTIGKRSVALANEPMFRWANIGKAFLEAVERAYDRSLLGV